MTFLHDRSIEVSVYGAIMLLTGAALLVAAFKAIDAPSNPLWIWVSAGWWFLVAAFLIIQGTVLLLTGHWLPWAGS